MISLKEVTIQKYKCFEEKQSFEIDPRITILVGMNEAGKTALLEAIAKTNYFTKDKEFVFNPTFDYPRKELKKYQKSDQVATVLECKYEISGELRESIEENLGKGTCKIKEFYYSKDYKNEGHFIGIDIDKDKFLKFKINQYKPIPKEFKEKIQKISNLEDINALREGMEDENCLELLEDLKAYYENKWKWEDALEEYVARVWIEPNIPKYLYYSEYYSLPSRIDLHDLQSEELEEESLKTSKALFELADINIEELINSDNFESYVAELEATSNHISEQIFKYWTTNQDLRIKFDVEKKTINNQVTPILDIRIENLNYMISLPLKNRSRGFNWFFSFIVWFSKIQEDKESNYILLLDEPALNLHASAQADLLSFITDLSNNYQVVYTSHSPFMIDSDHLERVRTLVETKKGTRISDSLQEKDPKTLFPLQAALGYDIAQNLFISKNNLLIEGPADLLFITILSNILEEENRVGLEKGITIVPVGGLDKVSTFISLLRGQKLNIACLLDSFESKGKQRLDDLIKQKIIKEKNIRFFDEFAKVKGGKADIEDMFEKKEYLKLFNSAFDEYKNIELKDLNPNIGKIVIQIKKFLNIDRFNHYRPANKLAQMAVKKDFFNKDTLQRFENMFKEINKLLS